MHRTLQFSRRLDLPPVATNRVYFSRPEEFATHRLLRAIIFQYSDVPSAGNGTPMPRVLSPVPGRSIFRTSAP